MIYAWVLSLSALGQKAVPELWNMRVHDDAHALRQETIDQLEKRLAHYQDSTSNQIAILIISSLDGETLEDYSIKVADAWKLGLKDKDNGVLLLIAVDDHKMRIEVGEGLEGVLTDALSSRIIRNEMAPAFRRGDFDSGVIAAIDGIIKAIAGEYTAEDTNDLEDLSANEKILIGLGLYFFLGIFAFFALVIPGCMGWGLYAFLIPFYSLFPAILVSEKNWYLPGLIYILAFPPLKLLVGRTGWGKKLSTKMGSGTSSGRGWSSRSSGSSSWGSGSSGGGFSGGGGSFGGGGSSGSW